MPNPISYALKIAMVKHICFLFECYYLFIVKTTKMYNHLCCIISLQQIFQCGIAKIYLFHVSKTELNFNNNLVVKYGKNVTA